MAEELLVTRVSAESTGVAGRAIASARNNHYVVDEPGYAGGPGEALTPAEGFLGGVAACAVLLLESFARQARVVLTRVKAAAEGVRTKENPADFVRVNLRLDLWGPDDRTARDLVEKFKGR